ncbi:MAG TPA: carbamoyl phosphate synthase large subunit, partial [Idiomarina sp.]|nr:carbamoyl phosphate synthase large subunit [Idiomarina sp.]
LNLKQPENSTVTGISQALTEAERIGYPLVVRPSYVLGGRAMEIVYDEQDLNRYLTEAVKVSNEAPVLLDRFLDNAIEVDVDAICDGEDVLIGGIMQHIEEAGVHSGDSACSLPPYSLSDIIQAQLREQMRKLAFELNVKGLMNAQFAVKDDEIYLIEVNPRAARTVPFVSKATGVPLAKVAARVMVGQSLKQQGYVKEIIPPYYSVKEVVIPFAKFQGVDPIRGPEMRSTGEVMGVGESFEEAYAKANLAAGEELARKGKALISVKDSDKRRLMDLARGLLALGFKLEATRGTAKMLAEEGIDCSVVNKLQEGRPNIVDAIKNGEYSYIINTVEGRQAIEDSVYIRREALLNKVIYTTTLNAAFATVKANTADDRARVSSVQELHKRVELL